MSDALAYAIGIEVLPSSMMEILLRAGVSQHFPEELEDLTAADVALLVNDNSNIVEIACAGLMGAPAHVVV